MFFVPHAGKIAHKPRPSNPTAMTAPAGDTPPLTAVWVRLNEDYRRAPESYDQLIEEAARTYGLDATLIRAVILTESAFDPLAISTAGAMGLMQLMPALAEELGVTDVFDARQNIMAGSRYLGDLLRFHNGNLPLALASYNAGPGNVERYGGVPPFEETQTYVRRITDIVEAEQTKPNQP
jgi:soluble lytic murein transglycosylase-like protein